jgi:hypothetical protein
VCSFQHDIVCDRANDRIQVFKPDGTFVKEAFIEKQTLGSGSVWDMTFSVDPQQKYLYVSDGGASCVYHTFPMMCAPPSQSRKFMVRRCVPTSWTIKIFAAADEIPDSLMSELLAKSGLRLRSHRRWPRPMRRNTAIACGTCHHWFPGG